MAKIFVSYKYWDQGVRPLPGIIATKARDYVDVLHDHLDENDHIVKGEDDGQSLTGFKDEYIASLLRDKIYDSSVTVVFVSKNMRNWLETEDDQWIPWEISYSLKEHTRDGRTSRTNAVIAVVLPDESGSYGHYIQDNSCPHCNCRSIITDNSFSIIKKNILNKRQPEKVICHNHFSGSEPHTGDHSYIHIVKWDDFINDIHTHIDTAVRINDNIGDYVIVKNN